jgi:hypothetical protein
MQAYKHIFTSPSSAEKEPRATRAGNARIHGMTKVTLPSIAYVCTQVRFSVFPLPALLLVSHRLQVRFALSSSPVFSRTDTVMDSERFYNSVLDLFEDPEETQEVNDLQTWWNRCDLPLHYVDLNLSNAGPAIQSNIPWLFIRTSSSLQRQHAGQDQGETSRDKSAFRRYMICIYICGY